MCTEIGRAVERKGGRQFVRGEADRSGVRVKRMVLHGGTLVVDFDPALPGGAPRRIVRDVLDLCVCEPWCG